MSKFTMTMMSEALHRPINIDAIIPTDHMVTPTFPMPEEEINKPYKTLYMLEGVCGDYSGPCKYSRLVGLAEDANICVFVIGGENNWYVNSSTTDNNYMNMIADDVVNFTRRAFNLSKKREDTYIGGFSMGGWGSVLIGLARPEVFSKIITIEPALNRELILEAPEITDWDLYTRKNYLAMFGVEDTMDIVDSENDYMWQAKECIRKGYAQDIYLCNGTTSHTPVGMTTQKLGIYLKECGHNTTYEEYEGMHSYLAYDNAIDGAFRWLNTNGFGENLHYYGPTAQLNVDHFARWRAWYNIEKDAAEGKNIHTPVRAGRLRPDMLEQ